jgi:hypothetical protein
MDNREAGSLILSYLKKSTLSFSLPELPGIQKFGLVVVIPCFEEPNIKKTLQSLLGCQKPKEEVLIIVVLNQGASPGPDWSGENLISKLQIQKVKSNTPAWLQISLVEALGLPEKKSGVGLARKIGMDLAAKALKKSLSPQSPIICLDADCTVDANYLKEIEDHFLNNPNTPACSIHFEHPMDGPNSVGIQYYELQLRYYVEALRWAGFPYSFQTVGSSMAVRAHIYASQGGMNQRKAGEDFYFLHKVIPLGGYTELNSTRVIPSDRISRRVPFGTGRAISKFENGIDDLSQYYDLQTFKDLKEFLSKVNSGMSSENELTKVFAQLPKTIKEYIGNRQWDSKISDILQNTAGKTSRSKRFFSWINAFWILKFTHYCRDSFYPNSDLLKNSSRLLELIVKSKTRRRDENVQDLLLLFRRRHRKET